MFEKSISIVIFGAKNCQKMPKSNNFSYLKNVKIDSKKILNFERIWKFLRIGLGLINPNAVKSRPDRVLGICWWLRIGLGLINPNALKSRPVDRIGSLSPAKFRWIGTEETIRHSSFVSKISEGVSSQLVEWSLGSLEKLSWNLT